MNQKHGQRSTKVIMMDIKTGTLTMLRTNTTKIFKTKCYLPLYYEYEERLFVSVGEQY